MSEILNKSDSLIPHLEGIKEIRKIEQNILLETHVPVRDISHWNSGNEYKKEILSQYKTNHPLDLGDYHYSYEYHDDIKQRVMSQLLCTSVNKYSCVFIHNATAAICCIADYLKKHNYKKICVLEPAYFSTYSCLLSFGLEVHKMDITFDKQGEVELPYNDILMQNYDAVWITSPIFSTGIYFSQKQANYLDTLTQKGVLVIIDESAASPNHILTRCLNPSDNIIAVFSPHKYLSINSVKFAIIICSASVSTYIEDWIDVFVGALPISACIAIEHYLSANFLTCLNIHNQYIEHNIKLVKELCDKYPDNYYNGFAANYISICNKVLPYVSSLNSLNMYEIMRQTHVSFIPGYINGFHEKWGFCYRINLTLDSNVIKNSLGRLFSYFS